MPDFEIALETTDRKLPVITCKEKDLIMRIFSRQTAFPPSALIICATVSGSEHYFEIMHPERDPSHKKWNMPLFFEAAEYFCQVVLDAEPDGFELINQQNFYPYERGEVTY